jgi:hypothetical protein
MAGLSDFHRCSPADGGTPIPLSTILPIEVRRRHAFALASAFRAGPSRCIPPESRRAAQGHDGGLGDRRWRRAKGGVCGAVRRPWLESSMRLAAGVHPLATRLGDFGQRRHILSDIPDVWSPGLPGRWPGFSIQPVINRVLTPSSLWAIFWPASVRTKRPCSLLTKLAPRRRSSVCVARDLFGRPELVSHFRREAISAIDRGSVVSCSNSSTSFSFDLAARISD